jgi:hypothetical protein
MKVAPSLLMRLDLEAGHAASPLLASLLADSFLVARFLGSLCQRKQKGSRQAVFGDIAPISILLNGENSQTHSPHLLCA